MTLDQLAAAVPDRTRNIDMRKRAFTLGGMEDALQHCAGAAVAEGQCVLVTDSTVDGQTFGAAWAALQTDEGTLRMPVYTVTIAKGDTFAPVWAGARSVRARALQVPP